MGAQTTPEQEKPALAEIKFANYLVQVRVISQSEVDISAVDTTTFQNFGIESHIFKQQVSAATLIAALQRQQEKYLRIAFSQTVDDAKQVSLTLNLKVSFDFIPSFEETIVLAQKKVNEQELFSTQLKFVNNQISELQTELDVTQSSKGKITHFIRSGSYTSAADTPVTFKLKNKGKYNISLDFYGQFPQGYGYVRLIANGQDLFQLYTNILYCATGMGTHYVPYSLSCPVNLAENSEVKLEFTNCNSSQIHVKNLMVSAVLIPETK